MPQRPDDASIQDSDSLWRGFGSTVVKGGVERVPSSAFKTNTGPDGEVSVDVAKLTTVAAAFRRRPDNIGYLADIDAGLPRSLSVEVSDAQAPRHYTVYLWDDGSGNPAHAHVHPPDGASSGQQDRYAKIMALRAKFIRRP